MAMAILDSTGTVRWQKEGCSIHDRMVHDVIIIVQEGRSILSAQPYPIKECPAAVHISHSANSSFTQYWLAQGSS